ncbi:MAG: hypothetical protein HY608_11550, partial [Planctomycetes bacterium]|nr:hypothetical protein [Planctomycetota bacterium]
LLACQTALFGDRPAGFRWISLLLHAGACLGAYRLLLAIGRPTGEARLATAWFASHPLQAGTVPYISAQPGILCAALSLWALHHYARASRAGARWRWGACAALTFGAALAKEPGLLLPAAFVLVDLLTPCEAPARRARNLRVAILVAAQAAGMLLVARDIASLTEHRASGRVLAFARQQAQVVPRDYLLGWLWPHRLEIHYGDMHYDAPPSPAPDAAKWAGFLFWPVAATALLALRRRAPYPAGMFLWGLLWLLPTNSFVPLGQIRFDHHGYLSSVGWGALCAWALVRAAGPRLAAASAACLLPLLAQLCDRASRWGEPTRLWGSAVATTPLAPAAHNNLAYYDQRTGNALHGARGFTHSLATGFSPKSLGNLAGCLADLGRTDEAAAHLRSALARDPALLPFWAGLAHLEYLRGDVPRSASALAEALRQGALQQKTQRAYDEIQRIFLNQDPRDARRWVLVGEALDAAGHADAARELRSVAARRFPEDPRFRTE